MVHPINKIYAKGHRKEYQDAQLIASCISSVLPKETDRIYIVRISSPSAVNDYRIMIKRLEENGSAEWDSDKQNRISIGDWLGFILGDTHEAIVELFKVVDKKDAKHRPNHWNNKKTKCISDIMIGKIESFSTITIQ